MSPSTVTRLYPPPHAELSLEGLYLQRSLLQKQNRQRPCVYTNFITSLDGRIAVEHPEQAGHNVPGSITNARDWRLYQELAAQADVLVVSARYLRELSQGRAQDALPLSADADYQDLLEWRRNQGLAPQPAVVILSASLDLPLQTLAEIKDREVFVATGEQADKAALAHITETGARVIQAGEEQRVEGGALIKALVAQGFSNIYSIAGPGVLETLLDANVLDRLYLTQAHRLIGGEAFDTLLEGRLDRGPANFRLAALYYDSSVENPFGQFFSVYEAGDNDHSS